MEKSRPSADWFLREWMQLSGKRQAALVNELGWTKNRAHLLWHGKQPYMREDVAVLSNWLRIEPFELLMHPRDALAMRGIRDHARAIAAEEPTAPPFEGPPAARRAAGAH